MGYRVVDGLVKNLDNGKVVYEGKNDAEAHRWLNEWIKKHPGKKCVDKEIMGSGSYARA